MLEKYLVLLESFKEYKVSEILDEVSKKALTILRSDYFTAEIKVFFETYNENGVPFDGFELEPDNITQIKKLLNAVYYAKLAFKDLENVDVRNTDRSVEDLRLLYNQTIHYGFLASQLATHLDIDLLKIFSKEITSILPLIQKMQDFAQNHLEEQQQITEVFKSYPLAYNAGLITGITVNQLQPDGGDLDYTFLTQLGGMLPGYIQQGTQLIRQYTNTIIENEPTLNREKLEEYRDVALSLLNNLQDLQGDDLFVSFKLLNYVNIINHIITLSSTILDEIGKLSGSSQDVIRTQLAQLKYELLPNLFGLIDKIEENSLLKPGTLSIPLMQQIEPLYKFLIYYAQKVVDFETQGEELLTIEDSQFVALRLKNTYQRINEAHKNLVEIDNAERAYTRFFEIIDSLPNQDMCTHQLADEIKSQLKEQYIHFKKYLAGIDFDVANATVHSLNGPETWTSWLSTPWRKVTGSLETDHLQRILACKDELQVHIQKDRVSNNFHIQLNQNLLKFIEEKANVTLFPHNPAHNVLMVDESQAFDSFDGLNFEEKDGLNIVANPQQLNSQQALALYQWYQHKLHQLDAAHEAFNKFIKLSRGNPLQLKYTEIKKARNLYNIFQAFFVSAAPEEQRQQIIDSDLHLTQVFSIRKVTVPAPARFFFDKLQAHYQNCFSETSEQWQTQCALYLAIANEKLVNEANALDLEAEPDPHHRAHYLIKHTYFSQALKDFRSIAVLSINQFNQTMQKELHIKPFNSVPYPEVEDAYSILEQPDQVIALKLIFNNLYHIEEILLQLEQVKDQTSPWALAKPYYEWDGTIRHLVNAYPHIYQIIKSCKYLLNDPQLTFIGRDLLHKARVVLATLQEHTYAYQAAPPVSLPKEDPVRYAPLWYVVNAFYVSPIHIRSIRNNNYISSEELNELHTAAKQSTVSIEKIIRDSGSYFRLFLLSPNMLVLYRSLKNKFYEFTSTAHDSVMHNLAQMQTSVFLPMLLEADAWENKLGLAGGTLSGPLKQIIDEYYKGLLNPLGLKSKTQIDLVCDKTLFDMREQEVRQTINASEEQLQNNKGKYQHLEDFYQFIIQHRAQIDAHPNSWTNVFKQELTQKYTLCLPRLVSLQNTLNIHQTFKNTDSQLDAVFNGLSANYDPKITHIIPTVTAGHHHYLGLQSTALTTCESAEEKLTYLQDLREQQQQEDALFIDNYTQKAFDRELDAVCTRYIGLQYMHKEYAEELKDHLLEYEHSILNHSKTAEDIDYTIRNLLQKHASQFEKSRYADYYHLETVRAALARFTRYLSQCNSEKYSVHEDDKTLVAKTRRINEVDAIAADSSLTIDERFKQIKKKIINDASFKKILYAQKVVEPFSLAYIHQCFIALLEALHLYTSSRKKSCDVIVDAVNNKPEIDVLINRFGLFAAKPTAPVAHAAPIVLPVALV